MTPLTRSRMVRLSLATSLTMGALATTALGCDENGAPFFGTTTTTGADYSTGSAATGDTSDGGGASTGSDNSSFGSMPMPNARTPLTPYNDTTGVTPGSGGVVVNGGGATNATMNNATNGAANVAPVMTNGYGATPSVSSGVNNGATNTVNNAVINGTNAGTTDVNGVPVQGSVNTSSVNATNSTNGTYSAPNASIAQQQQTQQTQSTQQAPGTPQTQGSQPTQQAATQQPTNANNQVSPGSTQLTPQFPAMGSMH